MQEGFWTEDYASYGGDRQTIYDTKSSKTSGILYDT